MHPKRITVWCGFWSRGLIEPFFFENERGESVIVKGDKCYADKPEIIDALTDNIREAIGEIELHTIDNGLKNWTNRVGYYMASRGSHLNEIIFHY